MRCLELILLLALSSCGQPQTPAPTPQSTSQSELQWQPTEIPNLEMAYVSGGPSTKGPVVVRLRAKSQVSVPAHWYPVEEQLTVLAGTPTLEMSDRSSKVRRLKPGESMTLPKDSRHTVQLDTGSEVELRGDGPFVTNWVDPKAVKALKPSDVQSLSDRTKMKAQQDQH